MTTRTNSQAHFDEQSLEVPELEEALERRQDLLSGHREYNKQNKAAKVLIEARDLNVGLYRVGRFQISIKQAEGGKEIAFTRNSTKTARIKLAEGEDE